MNVVISDEEIRLIETTEQDVTYVMNAEHDRENAKFVSEWSCTQHKEALHNDDILHLIVTNKDDIKIGYVIIRGLTNPNDSIELMRIVITNKGNGYGTKVLNLIKQWCFEDYKAHRLWLDVVEYNKRAQHVYKNQGFIQEGVLRECDKYHGQYNSLIIMSILKHEYERLKSS